LLQKEIDHHPWGPCQPLGHQNRDSTSHIIKHVSRIHAYNRQLDKMHQDCKSPLKVQNSTWTLFSVYIDVLFSKFVSLWGNLCDQVCFNKARFYKFYPLKSKIDVIKTILLWIELIGIPSGIYSDRAPELITGQFGKIPQKYRIRRTTTESNSTWISRGEGEGMTPIKNIERWLLQRYSAPLRLWDYAYELAAQILSLTCKPHLMYG